MLVGIIALLSLSAIAQARSPMPGTGSLGVLACSELHAMPFSGVRLNIDWIAAGPAGTPLTPGYYLATVTSQSCRRPFCPPRPGSPRSQTRDPRPYRARPSRNQACASQDCNSTGFDAGKCRFTALGSCHVRSRLRCLRRPHADRCLPRLTRQLARAAPWSNGDKERA